MPNNFDEARNATTELFDNGDNESVTEEKSNDNPQARIDNVENNSEVAIQDNQSTVAQAAQTAEDAALFAAQKDAEIQQINNELEVLRRQNQQLMGTIDELSKQNEERITEEAFSPPTIDINGLAFADEETQRAAMEKFAADITDYSKKQMLEELSPAIEYAKRGMYESEKREVIDTLSKIPQLSNISECLPQLDNLIAKNKWLSSDDMPLDEKYINAYALAQGINNINNPTKAPTALTNEELLNMYNNNSEFRELVEKQRLSEIKNTQNIPQFSASQGASGVALNIKEKPQTLEEASERTRRMFGV